MTSICSISCLCGPGEIARCTPQQKRSDIGLARLFPDQAHQAVLVLDIRDSKFQHLCWQWTTTMLIVDTRAVSWASHVDAVLWNNKCIWQIYIIASLFINCKYNVVHAGWRAHAWGLETYFTWTYAWLVDLLEDSFVDTQLVFNVQRFLWTPLGIWANWL